MSGGIYLIQDDGEPVEMTEQPYGTEDLLQRLLAEHPKLMAGDQSYGSEPRRFLLVSREMSLTSEEDGSGRWSVDHLFLDQDAIPTIVEVKRSSNTQIRREIVGQILDYAANAVVYWPVETLRARFEANREDPEQELAEFLETDTEPEEFWQKVKTNLQAGKARLIFVSDEIPTELRRIVEFLNQQMDPAEVLAVEIKQYVSQDSTLKTLVPRIIGQTVKAQESKSVGMRASRIRDERAFLETLDSNRGSDEATTAAKILEWAKSNGFSIVWGSASFTLVLNHAGQRHQVVGVYTNGALEIKFEYLQPKVPFNEEAKRLALRDRLNEVTGIQIQADEVTNRRPSYHLSVLHDKADLERFIAALDWFVREVKAT